MIGRLSEKVEKMKKNESTGAQNEQTESTGTVLYTNGKTFSFPKELQSMKTLLTSSRPTGQSIFGTPPYYDKVPETSLLFSLFCTVFAIWKHLDTDCFRYFAPF